MRGGLGIINKLRQRATRLYESTFFYLYLTFFEQKHKELAFSFHYVTPAIYFLPLRAYFSRILVYFFCSEVENIVLYHGEFTTKKIRYPYCDNIVVLVAAV